MALLAGGFDGFDNFFQGTGFLKKPVHIMFARDPGRFDITMPGEHDNLNFRTDLLEFPQGLHPVHARHFQIQEHHFRIVMPHHLDSIFAVVGCTDHLEVLSVLQDRHHQVPNGG